MPNEPAKPLQIAYTPEFKRNLRQLAKKYRHIRGDIQPTVDQLVAGGKPGDQITGVQQEVFKVRIGNSDARRGKSGGYRMIYHVKEEEAVTLITIYSKSDQADVPAAQIRRIIAEQEAADSKEPGEEDRDES
jgi:mRNA-degrading endonuclease RelE of RelBE toxin-antitoxin system